jgi:quercetin dioxygenase-like cupin family protein
MPTAVENFVLTNIDELEPATRLAPGATDDGRRRFDVRRDLGVTAFGVQAFGAPSGGRVISEHDENLLGEGGQEELYVVLRGAATFEIDGEAHEAPAGSMVQVQPGTRRTATSNEDGTIILVVGGTPGEAYKPAPEEAAEAFAAYNSGDFETALAKQLVFAEQRPESAVVQFNVACFAARAGHADQAIDALRRALELYERVSELIATDEDLDSIREDERFAELTR